MHMQVPSRTKYFFAATLAFALAACSAIQPPANPAPGQATQSAVATATPLAAQEDTTAEHAGHGDMSMHADTPFDAMFIDSMIEHHQGAIDMAEMALEKAEHEEIRTLSEQIVAAQTTEIEQMQGWRSEWFADLDRTSGMEMEMGEMMISDDASKPFDQRFIEAMISHHQGAIVMAEMALEQSEHEEIHTLAEAIIAAQTAEIEQMQGWLAEWYGITQ